MTVQQVDKCLGVKMKLINDGGLSKCCGPKTDIHIRHEIIIVKMQISDWIVTPFD